MPQEAVIWRGVGIMENFAAGFQPLFQPAHGQEFHRIPQSTSDIGKVARLLVDTNKTIAEICYECGYNNMSNFNRIFRRKKGCTPREFRENVPQKQVIA